MGILEPALPDSQGDIISTEPRFVAKTESVGLDRSGISADLLKRAGCLGRGHPTRD